MRNSKSILAAFALVLAGSAGAWAGDVRVMWYSDGVEGEVMQDLLTRFMKDNPGINVILDNVPYATVREQLPVQLEAGSGPDIARVTNLKGWAKHWLDLTPHVADPEYWKTNFGDKADWMRDDGSSAINGFMTQITLTGGYANKTLYEQAGVPLPTEKSTWDEVVEGAKKVAASQQLPHAIAIDRSGHRVTGPNISYGANYIGGDGLPGKIDAGTKEFIGRLVKWTQDGTANKEVWVSAAGTTYKPAADEFINAQAAYYYSGSWQVPNFATKIGTNFDWVATGSPCGPAACSGMPGGAGLVAIKYTKNPAEVGKVMDYLASEAIVKEFTERTLFLPAHKGVLEKGGINFQTDNPLVKDALNAYVKASGATAENAAKLPGWKWSDTVYAAIVARTSQAIAGELSLDDAYARMDSDIAAKVAEAGGK